MVDATERANSPRSVWPSRTRLVANAMQPAVSGTSPSTAIQPNGDVAIAAITRIRPMPKMTLAGMKLEKL